MSDFIDRHCGLSASDQAQMLALFGFSDLEELTCALPKDVLAPVADLEPPLSERQAHAALYRYARQNQVLVNMIGLGYYDTYMPALIRRKLMEDPSWYTAYTPYQAEVAQGRLEMLLNFQTMIADLTGLPMAGASLLDEATAAAEAMMMFLRECKSQRSVFLVDENLFPQTLAVVKTRAKPLGVCVVTTDIEGMVNCDEAFGALLAYPSMSGAVSDLSTSITRLKEKDIAVAVATDLLALMLIKSPGDMGADVALGSSQRFGLPLGAGGPHAGFFAFRDKYKMRVPGRIVGVSKDVKGRIGYRLSLQAREQHIRREKATSNICTAQALPAMLSAAYAIYHGPQRLKNIANRVQSLAEILANGLKQMGYHLVEDSFFGTVQVYSDCANHVVARAQANKINLLALPDIVSISVDQMTLPEHIEKIWQSFSDSVPTFSQCQRQAQSVLAPSLKRQDSVLTHPVFSTHHTEQQMLRYLRQLADKDIALNRSMIPLGSCTMKLNATVEMEPISWPQFSNIHPFAPPSQILGYQDLTDDLGKMLLKLTGFDAICLQPNAGAQGEYAGLLTIMAYLKNQGQGHRNVCLIPKSAHGTNPASAQMAGLKVVVVDIDEGGQVLLTDLKEKVQAHREHLAVLMLTYPSTCGVFGKSLSTLCQIVHDVGAQVYMDGANLNALIGVSLPGKLGPDVMHINLHKTFCIPHGGGGPGMGPIVVNNHLTPYLPGHPLSPSPAKSCGTVSAAPYGSALILVIPWLYIRLMGSEGLRRATLTAILNANYITRRLEKHYPLIYRGDGGFVAHECIMDASEFKKSAGISVEDIAKRLMDFGFHAPTVAWPVADSMMIEPTESESKAQLDNFCDALLTIRGEIDKVIQGQWPKQDNPLINAPHTAEDIVADQWTHPYRREEAVYPLAMLRDNKYWPPVGRILAAYGDRNLVCQCPPLSAYEKQEGGS